MNLDHLQTAFRDALLRPVEPDPPKMDATQVLDLTHGNPEGNLRLPFLRSLEYHYIKKRRRRAPGLVLVAILRLGLLLDLVVLLRLRRLVLAVVFT